MVAAAAVAVPVRAAALAALLSLFAFDPSLSAILQFCNPAISAV
jgi:hypothetical protein